MVNLTIKRKLIAGATIVLPLIFYLISMATFLNADIHFYIHGNVEIEGNAIYAVDESAAFYGNVVYMSEYDAYGIRVPEGMNVVVNDKYYSYQMNVETKETELMEMSVWQIKKQESWKLPFSIVISMVGLVIIGAMMFRKSRISKKNRVLGIFISLGVGTFFLYLINLVVANLFYVFLIAFISWGVFMAEYYYWYFKDGEHNRKKTLSNTEKMLDGILKELR